MTELRKMTPEEYAAASVIGTDFPGGTTENQQYLQALGDKLKEITDQNASAQNANNQEAQNHIDRVNNPHGVTKVQVGLANVDNTPDANKPVSAPQAAQIAQSKTNAVSEAVLASKVYTDQKVTEAKVNPPYIGADGFWYIYDFVRGKFIKTDAVAQGPSGPPGPNGPPGAQGEKGPQGGPMHVAGSFDTIEQINAAFPKGNGDNAYLVGDTIHVWDGVAWKSAGVTLGGDYLGFEELTPATHTIELDARLLNGKEEAYFASKLWVGDKLTEKVSTNWSITYPTDIVKDFNLLPNGYVRVGGGEMLNSPISAFNGEVLTLKDGKGLITQKATSAENVIYARCYVGLWYPWVALATAQTPRLHGFYQTEGLVYSAGCGYSRDQFGRVFLDLEINMPYLEPNVPSGTFGDNRLLTILPKGYRPQHYKALTAITLDSTRGYIAGLIVIDAQSGQVLLENAGANSTIVRASVSFQGDVI